MHLDDIKLPRDLAAEAERTAAFDRKQKWKELPGNRYTPKELKLMAASFGEITIVRRKHRVMYID